MQIFDNINTDSINANIPLRQLLLKLESSEHELTEIIHLLPFPMVILKGADHFVSFANPAHDKLAGKFIQGKLLKEMYSEKELGNSISLLNSVYETGQAFEAKEVLYRIIDQNDISKNIYVNIGFFPLHDLQGKVTSVLKVSQDVSELVRARNSAIIERDRMYSFFSQTPIMLNIQEGPEHIFTYVHPLTKQLLGGKDVLGLAARKALPNMKNQDYFSILDQVYKNGNPYQQKAVPSEMLSPENTMKQSYWNFTYHPWRDMEKNIVGVMTCATDATDEVLAKKNAEEKNLELIAEKESREHFVITLAHDLRSPLATAKMSAQLLESDNENLVEVVKYAQMISRNIDRADRMIRDLLDANQIKAGENLSLEIEPCELRQLANDTLTELNAIHENRIQLIADGSIEGYWSKSDLRRVIENLCSNAIKYGSKDGTVKVKLIKLDRHCQIEVHNEGSVISEKDQRLLFNQHLRTKSAKSRGIKGWGLGLALVKGIAEAHGGNVTVDSSVESGTTFRLVIPLDSRTEIN